MPQNSANCFNHTKNHTKNLVLPVSRSGKRGALSHGIKGAAPQNAVSFPCSPPFPPQITHIKYDCYGYYHGCFLISHEDAQVLIYMS